MAGAPAGVLKHEGAMNAGLVEHALEFREKLERCGGEQGNARQEEA